MVNKKLPAMPAGRQVKAKKIVASKPQVSKKELAKGVQVMRGRVVAAKQPKTVTVLIERRKVHHFYQKSFMRSKKYLVHDELGVKAGDVVEIMKIKPISKNKHFGIVKVVGKDMEAIISQQLKEEAAAEIAEVMPEEREEEPSEEAQTQEAEELKVNDKKNKKNKSTEGGMK